MLAQLGTNHIHNGSGLGRVEPSECAGVLLTKAVTPAGLSAWKKLAGRTSRSSAG